tara:strand:+ start:3089 stop:5215 length:2127 start_codon:yes stop_codon:yes gene_type:complete
MSVFSINETLSGLNITGSLKILYDFSSFDGVNQINSVSLGDPTYSGEIVNGNSQFTGHNSGSGYFTDQYINIPNGTEITSENCTILFSQEKTGVGPGTIFSNFNSPSGFELGITAANKFYYKNSVDGALNHVTLESYGCDKNLYAFTMGENGGGALRRLDFKQRQETMFALGFTNAGNDASPEGQRAPVKYYEFTKKDILVPDYTVSLGDNWKIGSGEFLYQGYMDYFLFFDTVLGDDTLRQIARAIHVETEYIDPQTGVVSGSITGFTTTPFEVTGDVGTALSLSGTQTPSGYYTFLSGTPVTGAVGVSGEVFVPKAEVSGIAGTDLAGQTIYRRITNLSITHTLTGGMSVSGLPDYYSKGSYWEFSGNSGTYNGVEGIGPVGTIVGVTGFTVSTQTGYTTGVGISVITGATQTGVSGSGYNFEPLTEPDITYTGTGGYFSSGPNEDPSYYASALSLIGPPDADYAYELIYDISGASSIEEAALVQQNTTYGVETAFMTGTTPLSGINLYINGVSSFTGKAIFGKNEFNFPTVAVESGFDTNLAEIFTTTTLNDNSEVTYDLVSNQPREHLTITNTSEYSSMPFSEITEADNDIFFNGVRLLSGTDYTFLGGFRPQGEILNDTGVYFTYPSYTGDPVLLRETGFLSEPFSVEGDEITPYGYVLYFNGIRQPTSNIIEHGKTCDLITGTYKNINSKIVYQMLNGVTQE